MADAIGRAFEAVLTISRPADAHDIDFELWRARARALDYRVLCGTGWNIVDRTTFPISNFGAGGGVTKAPSW